MHIRPATAEDAAAIVGIYNQAVTGSTASFDTEPKTVEDRSRWLLGRQPRHPVLVADEKGEVVGWGALSPYSDRAAYAATAEISVYVDENHRGLGSGRALTEALLEAGRRAGLHAILARICSENTESISMVRSLGFTEAGTMHEVGRKFGRWLDVVTWEYRVQESPGCRDSSFGANT
ncbi:MAG: N-acetyltransferase [Coriobacteriia bacterium]|nr:N-acetyltransferase [Coriobacteriia bacterium]